MLFSIPGIILLIFAIANSAIALLGIYESDERWFLYFYKVIALPIILYIICVFSLGFIYKFSFTVSHIICPMKTFSFLKWLAGTTNDMRDFKYDDD